VANSTWEERHTAQYQQLDAVITNAMKCAENNTGQSFSTKFEWSPKLLQALHL